MTATKRRLTADAARVVIRARRRRVELSLSLSAAAAEDVLRALWIQTTRAMNYKPQPHSRRKA